MSKKTTMSRKSTMKVDAVESVPSLKEAMEGIFAGSMPNTDNMPEKERVFVQVFCGEVSRAAFAAKYLIVKGSKEESLKKLGLYMKDMREKLGNPKKVDLLWKASDRVRSALAMAINREFPKAKSTPKGKGDKKVDGEAITTEPAEKTTKVTKELALSQFNSNMTAVLNAALESTGKNRQQLAEIAGDIIAAWSSK